MKSTDILVLIAERFSIGIEEGSEKYLSIPVANSLVSCEEYGEINKDEFDAFTANATAAAEFVRQCRRRELDDRLIMKPGRDRGSAL